jgi:hypothetical protein
MTQPVNEPTTQRSIAYGAWRTNQLERRPSPQTAGDPSIYAVVTWLDGADVGPDDHFNPESWDDFYLSEDAAESEVLKAPDSATQFGIILEGAEDPDPNAEAGYWMQQVVAEWSETPITGWVLCTATGSFPAQIYSATDVNDWEPTEMLFEHNFNQAHAAEAHRIVDPTGSDGSFGAEFGAWTGSTAFLAATTMFVVKIEPYMGAGSYVIP